MPEREVMVEQKAGLTPNTDTRNKTIKGIKWSMLDQLVTKGANLLISILLARLLSPRDFGLIGMVTIFIGFLAVFKDFGMGSALIYKDDIREQDKSTVFWTQLALGVLLAGSLMLASGPIAAFFGEPQLLPLALFLSLTFIVESANYVQLTLLKRDLNFRMIFWVNASSVLISGAIAIYLAFKGYGVWSIAWKIIILSVVQVPILWILSSWRPKFVFSRSGLKEILDYSLPIVGSKFVGYFMRNSDSFLIGKVLGSASLGIYNRAYSLMMFPTGMVSSVLVRVLFPSFSRYKHDRALIRRNWQKLNRVIGFVIFPLTAFFILLAKPFTLVILGPQWEDAIPIIQILSLVACGQPLLQTGMILNAIGKTRLNFHLNVIADISLIVAIIVGLQFGVKGVAIFYTSAYLLITPPIRLYFTGKEIDLSPIDYLKNLFPYFFPTLLIGLGEFVLIQNLEISLAWQLVLVPFSFSIIYLPVLFLFGDRTLQTIFQAIRQ